MKPGIKVYVREEHANNVCNINLEYNQSHPIGVNTSYEDEVTLQNDKGSIIKYMHDNVLGMGKIISQSRSRSATFQGYLTLRNPQVHIFEKSSDFNENC